MRQSGVDQGARISIFIPAYQAADYLEALIARIPPILWPNVVSCWVLNDGSTDGTRAIIEKLSIENSKIRLIDSAVNRGYGATVQDGLTRCREDDCECAVCLHADGQYPPEEIPRFVETLTRERFDILQGSRIASGTALSGGMPLYKFVAGKVLTFFENRAFGLSMTDYHSGYLFYSSAALQQIPFKQLSHSFDFDLEVIASARAQGLKVGELPIPTRYAGEKSHLHPIGYGFRVLGVMAKYLLGRYGRSR